MRPGLAPKLLKRRALLVGSLGAAAMGDARATEALLLSKDAPRLPLPAGRSNLQISLPERSFATIAVLGPQDALLGLSFLGHPSARRIQSRTPLEEDGLLPRTVSLLTQDAVVLFAILDVRDNVELRLVTAPADEVTEPTAAGLKSGKEEARPLVGFPVPSSDRAGYMLAAAGRYVFARSDVIHSLMSAFEKTRKKFASDPIAISDASQWNGKRPKTDLGEVRHISHEGGCDIDLALPANDTIPSTLRDHCRGVRLAEDRFGCAPGTAKGVDFERLAFLLGTLADEAPGRITKVFLDDVYRREVVRVAPSLFEKKWIEQAGSVALSEDGVLVASPWHTDHIHVRFSGEKARVLF